MKHKKSHNSIPTYHVVQEFLNAKHDKRKCAQKAAKLKYSIPVSTLIESLNILFKTSSNYKPLLWGNCFPSSISELGEGNSYFYKSEDIVGDYNWLYIPISKNACLLKEYILYRDQIERDILLGYYSPALEKLEIIKKRFGESIWYYEMRLIINSYSDHEEYSLELLSNINKSKKDSKYGFVPFLLSYLYKRSSKTYSAFAFDSELESKFRMNRTIFQKDRYAYFLLRLNFYKTYTISDLSPALIMEATNSLIDRYNLFIELIKASYINAQTLHDKQTYASIATKFYRKVEDPRLSSLAAYTNTKALPLSYFNQDYITLLDSYYSGDYLLTIEKCKDFILKETPEFDVICIYCRSIIAMQKPFSPICGNNNSIANNVARLVFHSMTQFDSDNELSSLYQINKNIYGFNLSNGLNYYIFGKKNHSNEELKYLSLTHFDPSVCNIFPSIESKDEYLNCSNKFINNGIAVQYQLCRNKKSFKNAPKVAKYITDIDSAKDEFERNNFSTALSLWKSVLQDNASIIPIVQLANDYIYRCYENLGQKQEAVSMYVDQYIKGKTYTALIDTSSMIDNLYREKYKKGVKIGLDLQLFVFLNAKEDERKSAVLEKYCHYKDIEKVSDLVFELDEEKDRNKVEFYLYLLASEDILRHMLYVKSTKTLLEEQQKIVQYLTSLTDSTKIEQYNALNQEILDTMIVYQSIKKIDESKIFVNQSALIKYEYREFEGLYNQFKRQFESSGSTNTYYIVNTVEELLDINKDHSIINAPVKFTNKAFIDSACQVFSVLREKFLYSKFGLKTYLSTRIRHGVLEGVLRSGYDGLHLLLSTENNRYVPTRYWTTKYGLKSEEQEELMKILEKFSRGINTAIDAFKEDALQIRIEDTEKGLFNYILTPDDMCFATVQANVKSNNYEEFCALIIEYLLHMTNKCLVDIRKEIESNLKTRFNTLVDMLAQEIHLFNKSHFYNEINNAVINARAETMQKIAHIEKWFYLQDAKFEDFSLTQQIKAVWAITAKMYPNTIVNLDISGEDNDVKIKADYIIHVSDMLTIFYNNMFCYSKVEPHRTFRIAIKQECESVILEFENSIKDDEETLNSKFHEMLQSDNRLSLEGRSGLVKVKKIIKDELSCDKNVLTICAKDGICKASVTINLEEIRA